MKRTIHLLLLTAVLPLALVGCARSGETMNDNDVVMADGAIVSTPVEGGSEEAMELLEAATSESNTIVENALAIPNLSNLVEAVRAAGLAETLSGPGEFTVFAPTNEAFDIAGMTEFEMMSDDDVEGLQELLRSHVADGDLEYDEFTEGYLVEMLSGEQFPILLEEDEFISKRIGAADFVVYDIESSNGVIHVINLVLNPEDM
jgi:uncharacterized surface protein with fasciclin (FAS1) repeats